MLSRDIVVKSWISKGAKLYLVSVFPHIVKDYPKIRKLPKIFLRSFENVAPGSYLLTYLFTLLLTAHYYRAMHFSAKRGIAIACRLSVRPSVTLVDCDHIGWNSSKIISPLVSPGCSLFATPTWRVCSKGNAPKFWPKVTHPLLTWASETFDRKLRPNGYR